MNYLEEAKKFQEQMHDNSDRDYEFVAVNDALTAHTEPEGERIPFTRVDLEDVLRAYADGMPIFRKCFEHETLMSFYDDDGNYQFREWWEVEGRYLFNNWLNQQEDK